MIAQLRSRDWIEVPAPVGLRRRGGDADGESEYSNKVMAMISSGVPRACRAFAALALLTSAAASANPVPWQLNMTPGVTPISQRIHDVHMLAFWVCVAIGIVVFGAMIYAMVKFRKSNGAVAAKFSHNSTMEAIWTVLPIIILVVMAWPATKLLVDMADVENSDMTIKVTGYQWKWRYQYVDYFKKASSVNFISSLDADSNRVRQLGSGLDPNSVKVGDENTYLLNVDKPLVLPVGVKIRFVITADDVIHAWWVPSLGWKQDAIPGIINDNWTRIDKPGIYRGQCAELCGKDHGFMPIVVKAVPKAEFEQWLATQEPAAAAEKAPATAQVGTQPAPQS
jgi:cytochrome c oxidase subunit 2